MVLKLVDVSSSAPCPSPCVPQPLGARWAAGAGGPATATCHITCKQPGDPRVFPAHTGAASHERGVPGCMCEAGCPRGHAAPGRAQHTERGAHLASAGDRDPGNSPKVTWKLHISACQSRSSPTLPYQSLPTSAWLPPPCHFPQASAARPAPCEARSNLQWTPGRRPGEKQ